MGELSVARFRAIVGSRFAIRLIAVLAVIFAVLGGLAGLGYYLTHYVDSVRVVYKRWKAPSPYVFDEIHPSLKRTNPADLIRISSAADVAVRRRALTQAIWGTASLPADQPAQVTDVPSPIEGLAVPVQRIEVPIDYGYKSVVYLFRSTPKTDRVLLYQNGYAGTFVEAAALIRAALAAGYSVAAFNYPGYGENQYPTAYFPRFGWFTPSHDRILTLDAHPIRFYVQPIVVFVNYVVATRAYKEFDLAGFSAGGWVSAVAAAVDPRLRRTYAVAGGYPLYLLDGQREKQASPPQFYGPLLHAANHLEMYVLAASGAGRAFTQIFNRYDRCCYRNRLGKLYEPAVQAAAAATGAGAFRVLIDETHADHKVSDWAIARIVESLTSGE